MRTGAPDGAAAERRREWSGSTGVVYQGIACASLLLERPLADYYVTNITDGWVPFTGVIEMTTLVDRERFGGRSLVYLPRYLAQDDAFWGKSDDEIRELFVSALERMYPALQAGAGARVPGVARARKCSPYRHSTTRRSGCRRSPPRCRTSRSSTRRRSPTARST